MPMKATAKRQLTQAVTHEAAHAPLLIEEQTGGVEIIERLAAEWRTLCAEGRSPQPFFQPEWIAAYVRAFAADQTLVVFTARRNGQLRAVLPLISERTPLHGIPVRKLRSPANAHSCRFDLIAGRDDAEEAVRALWQALQRRGGWDVIELFDVPEGGLGEQLLALAASAAFPTGQWEMPAASYLPLAVLGATTEERLEATLRQVSVKRWNEVRRLRRKLEEQGVVQVSCEEQARATELDRFYALERAGWKGDRGTAIACDDRVRQFYNTLAHAVADRGRLWLYRMDCGGQTIAMQFCVTDDQTCYLLKPAYDEAFRKYSPGHLLVAEVLRDVLARGMTTYDLLSPVSEWKRYWTKATHAQTHCYIFRRDFIGHALHAWKFQVALHARPLKQKLKQKYQGSAD
jgi:CelD/BcsL family acetyltransferase involved in cellulose biosynthesis